MRASGILLPVTSLPSPYGIGCFSKEAYEFVDQLEKGGEKYWQILPLGPTGYGDSPYQSFSTYAGNPYFIDLETLIEEGLLTKEECDSVDFGSNPAYVDYEKIYMGRFELLEKAFHRFVPDQAYETFVEKNKKWLEDYSLYMAIKNSLGGIAWSEWDVNIISVSYPPEVEKMAEKVAAQSFITDTNKYVTVAAADGMEKGGGIAVGRAALIGFVHGIRQAGQNRRRERLAAGFGRQGRRKTIVGQVVKHAHDSID